MDLPEDRTDGPEFSPPAPAGDGTGFANEIVVAARKADLKKRGLIRKESFQGNQ